MADPVGAVQLGLSLIKTASKAIQDVRGAGENIAELKAEVKTLESVLRYLEKDRELNPAEAEVLDVPIHRCNDVIKGITKKLKSFSYSNLGFMQSIEAAWGQSGFDKSLVTLRRDVKLLMGTRTMLSAARQDKFVADKQQSIENAILMMASAKAPDGKSLIEMLLSLIDRPGQDHNKQLKVEIESVLQQPKSDISISVVHRRLQGNHLDIFVCADDGQVYTARWSESYFEPVDFKGWLCLPAPPDKTFPPGAPVTALSRKPDQLDVFICGNDGHVYTTWWNADRGWHYNWRDIGGHFLPGARISAVARNPEHLDVFASAGDGNVYTCWWAKEAGQWKGPLGSSLQKWRNLGGERHRKSASAVNVATLSRAPDALDVFFCDDAGQVCYKNWTKQAGWDKEWATLGKSLLVPGGFVTAVSRHKDQVDLFACGTDGKVYTSWSNSSKHQWSGNTRGWKCLGGGFKGGSQVSAVAREAGALDLHVIGTGGLVYHLGWNSSDRWGSWSEIGGTPDTDGQVGCVVLDSSTLQVFLATRKWTEEGMIEVFTIRGEDAYRNIHFGEKKWKSLGTIR